jgi:PAB-dependent poly(A)-specific ribonuclease subunit 2
MPYYSSPLLSLWPNDMQFPVGRPPSKIPPEILKNVKMVDFVGYAPNPKTLRRNQAAAWAMRDPNKPKFRSEQELERLKSGHNSNVCSVFNKLGCSS